MGSVLRIAKNDFTNVRRSRLLWGVVGAYAAFTLLLVVSQATTAITSATELLVGVTGITAVVLPAVALVAGKLISRGTTVVLGLGAAFVVALVLAIFLRGENPAL
jgi:ABC-2 type transport system permease protein